MARALPVLVCVVWMAWWVPNAQETLTLSTPVFQQTGVADFRVWSLHLKRERPGEIAEIRVLLAEVSDRAFVANGRTIPCFYTDAEAEMLIIALNKMNLSTISMERRVVTRCQQDGKLPPGTIDGSPQ